MSEIKSSGTLPDFEYIPPPPSSERNRPFEKALNNPFRPYITNTGLYRLDNLFRKRVFDVVFSTLVLLFILSWLIPLLGLMIKIGSKGPVFYSKNVRGRNDRVYKCLKFRTNFINEPNSLTPVGQFLKKTDLDKFPMFFNVLFGDMSIVGTKFNLSSHIELDIDVIRNFIIYNYLSPGIYDIAIDLIDVYNESNSLKINPENPKFYSWYIENWSLNLDTKVLIKGLLRLFKGK